VFKEITENEKSLLERAKVILSMNSDIGAALTGSLMLAVRGIERRREAVDVDIICEYLCEKEEGFPSMPSEFKVSGIEGGRSEVDAIQFISKIDGLKIDFLYSDEECEVVDGISLGSVKELIEAKGRYAKNDKCDESRGKHQFDLVVLKNASTNA